MTSDSEEDRKALGRQIAVFQRVTTIASDAMSLLGVPSEIVKAAAEGAVTKRRNEARDVLIDELTIGDANFEPEILEQVDESAAIMLRYLRAADEGVRARNLRLLARAFRRQLDEKRADASSFQQTAASIGDLSDAELELLGRWFAFGPKLQLSDLIGSLKVQPDAVKEFYALAASLFRNGLMVPGSVFGGLSYELSPSAIRLLVDLRPEDFNEPTVSAE